MKSEVKLRLGVLLLLVLITHHASLITAASANGLYVADNGPKAMGMGGAFTARPTDAFALYYNPAGLSALRHREAYLSLGGLFWQSSFARKPASDATGPDSTTTYPYGTNFPRVDNEALPTPLPAAFLVWPFAWHRLTLGGGFMTPVGPLFLEYPEDGPQRFMIIDSARTESYVMLGGAGELFKGLSFGGVFILDSVTLKLRQAILASAHTTESPAREGLAELNVDKFAEPTFIVGGRYATDKLSVGVAYQRGSDLQLKGTLDARIQTQLNQILGMSMFGEQPVSIRTTKDVSVMLRTPHVVRSGLGYQFGKFYSELDFDYWQWSRFKEFRIDIADTSLPLDPPLNIGVSLAGFEVQQSLSDLSLEDRVIPQPLKDTMDLRWGGEYHWSEPLDLRAGIHYQPGAVPTRDLTPLTFDAQTVGLTAGCTRRFGRFYLDASAAAYLMATRKVEHSEITGYNGLTGSDPTTKDLMEKLLGYDVEDPVVGNGTFAGSAYLLYLGAGYQF
ncbi:MAG: outer membrane protein transport protein [Nitrospirae bacterium]|nr:outer membrane protein transport protein [Nitrospirota bacterium]